MNLLRDKREQRWRTSSDEPFNEPKSEPEDDLRIPETTPSLSTTEQFPDFHRQPREKNSLVPFLIIFASLSVLFTIIYFAFFKSTQQPETAQLPPSEQTPTQEQSPDQQPTTITTLGESTVQQPAAVPSGADVTSLAGVVAVVNQALSGDVRLATLFMDESTFSVEVTSASPTSLTNFINTLKQMLPTDFSFSTVPASNFTNRLLVNAIFPAMKSAASSAATLSAAQLRSELVTMVRDSGTSLDEITISEPRTWNQIKRSDVYLKTRGSLAQCQAMLEKYHQKGWNSKILKVIAMPLDTNLINFVLRFQYQY